MLKEDQTSPLIPNGEPTVPEIKKTIMVGGQPKQGCSVPVKKTEENWNIYTLEDGSVLRLKPVVTEVIRLDGYSEDGDPVYMVKSTNVMGVDAAENLKKKA